MEPNMQILSSSSYHSALSVKLIVKDVGLSFSILNIYGSYDDRIPFWEELANAGAFNDPLTLVGGDLNFTLSHREVWGDNPRVDAHRGFFITFLANHHLVDVEPVKIVPTWCKLSF
jgi:hypothetical protein